MHYKYYDDDDDDCYNTETHTHTLTHQSLIILYLLSFICRTAPFLYHKKNGCGLPVALQINCRSWPSSTASSNPPSSMKLGAVSPSVIHRNTIRTVHSCSKCTAHPLISVASQPIMYHTLLHCIHCSDSSRPPSPTTDATAAGYIDCFQ